MVSAHQLLASKLIPSEDLGEETLKFITLDGTANCAGPMTAFLLNVDLMGIFGEDPAIQTVIVLPVLLFAPPLVGAR